MLWDEEALRGPPTKIQMAYDDGWRQVSSLDYARPPPYTDLVKLRELASYIFKSPCAEPWLLQQDPDFEFLALEVPYPATIPPDRDDDDGGDGSTDDGTDVSAGFSCVARVSSPRTRVPPNPTEMGFFKYFKRHTNVPVPEIYDYGFTEDGTWYVMMERLPGRVQSEMAFFDRLTHAQLMLIEGQKAAYFAEAASLRFNEIGSVSATGEVGPLFQKYCDRCSKAGPSWCEDCPGQFIGPYNSIEEYMHYLVSPQKWDTFDPSKEVPQEFNDLCSRMRGALRIYFTGPVHDIPSLQAPFGLSLLCSWRHVLIDPSGPEPRITAYLVLDNCHTQSLYNIFSQRPYAGVESHAESQELVRHFNHCLRDRLAPHAREALDHRMGWRNTGLEYFLSYVPPNPFDNLDIILLFEATQRLALGLGEPGREIISGLSVPGQVEEEEDAMDS